MPRRKEYPPFGSVSTATMLTEDLLSAFAPWCAEFGGRTGKKLAREYDRMSEGETMSDDADELLSEMFDLLDSVSPPYGYFGAHEGDGADYGFWISWDAIEDDARYGQVLKIEDLADIPTSYRGEVVHVNDHGNVTLYLKTARTLREIWSVV